MDMLNREFTKYDKEFDRVLKRKWYVKNRVRVTLLNVTTESNDWFLREPFAHWLYNFSLHHSSLFYFLDTTSIAQFKQAIDHVEAQLPFPIEHSNKLVQNAFELCRNDYERMELAMVISHVE